jgi:ketosteroid isomerase-like protein
MKLEFAAFSTLLSIGSEPMTDRAAVEDWIRRYVQAWSTNDTTEIEDLFTEEAAYFTAPYREPWRGREAIVGGWQERREPPDTWTFEFEVAGVDGDTGFVRGRTVYASGEGSFANLWLIRLDDQGRAFEFVEWWMRADS